MLFVEIDVCPPFLSFDLKVYDELFRFAAWVALHSGRMVQLFTRLFRTGACDASHYTWDYIFIKFYRERRPALG